MFETKLFSEKKLKMKETNCNIASFQEFQTHYDIILFLLLSSNDIIIIIINTILTDCTC